MTRTTTVTVAYRPPGSPSDDQLIAACDQLREHLDGIRTEPGVIYASVGRHRAPWDRDDVVVNVRVKLDGPVGYANVEAGYRLATRVVYLAGGTDLGLDTEHIKDVSYKRAGEPVGAEVAEVAADAEVPAGV